MHNVFNLMPGVSAPVLHAANWTTVRAGLKQNLLSVLRYYRKNPTAVAADHFLVRLLHAITTPKSLGAERFYYNVQSLSSDVAMALKLTSPYSKGGLHHGVFYGAGVDEILISTDEEFNPYEAEANWQNLCPIQVMRHPRSDLMLNIPDGRNWSPEIGLAVITINIPLLAMQYRGFRLEEERIAMEMNDSQRSMMQFIRMYVLPNMLASHLDIAFFNRFHNLVTGAPHGESDRQHSFPLPDYSKRVDAINETLLDNLTKVHRSMAGILRSIPAINKVDMHQVMQVPDLPLTRQVLWALAISRMPALDLMARVSVGLRTTNGQEVNKIIQTVRKYHTDTIMESVLPRDTFYIVESEIDDIMQLLTA